MTKPKRWETNDLRALWLPVFLGIAILALSSSQREPLLRALETPEPPDPSLNVLLVEKTNAYRQKNDYMPLKVNSQLNQAAENFVQTLIKEDEFSHEAGGTTPAERVTATGYQWRFVAENIAFRTGRETLTEDQFAAAILQGWIDSPGHNKNLLNGQPTECGVAFGTNEDTGKTFAVMIYARPKQ